MEVEKLIKISLTAALLVMLTSSLTVLQSAMTLSRTADQILISHAVDKDTGS